MSLTPVSWGSERRSWSEGELPVRGVEGVSVLLGVEEPEGGV